MITIEISKDDLYHVLLALQVYKKALLDDEEDAGPSYADSLLVAHIESKLQEKFDQASE